MIKDANGNDLKLQNLAGDGSTQSVNSNPGIQRASVALGYGASADNGNIALGSYSDASTDLRTQTDDKYKSYLTNKTADSYISVGSSTELRRVSNVADGALDTDVATIAQLKKVADNKVAWKLTTAGDNDNASTVSAGDTLDFSAAKDSQSKGQAGDKDHSNLTISKTNGTNQVNMTVGLSDNVILGQNASDKGGSLDVYRAIADAKSDEETNEKNQTYDQLGDHVRIDGSTVSIHYDNGTSDSDARGVVLGIANDSYADPNDSKKTVNSPLGYVYLQDGKNYYYIHGALHGDTKYQGRLAYDSSATGYTDYIANLNDGLKFTGDTKKDGKAITVDTKLDNNALNNTLSITGGADTTDTTKLTSGNIGVVATANTTDNNGDVTKAGGLSIQLAKDLTGITSITSQTTGSTTGAKVTLDTADKNINVNDGKVTGLSDGDVKADSTDAVTGKQLYNLDNSSVKYDTKTDGTVDKTKITLAGSTDGTTITNVKAGALNETSTDAVNGAQLYAEQQARNKAIGAAKTKYYSVADGIQLSGFDTNADNKGASAIASMAAGYTTSTTGIASTVAGSYSGITGSGLQGAAAVSLGTVNVNNNTDTSKAYSGVANSIVGQANMTTNSNAAIIVGAGNSVTNSYRDLFDKDKNQDALTAIKNAATSKDADALKKALQDAVPNSGAQVMAIGGGNSVDKAYMTQVVGVGNTVTGSDATYKEGTSTQYNYVDGFQNELTNGKNDYIIGSNNHVTGDKIATNQSNIVVGDNHTLKNKSNNVVIGSADNQTELTASDAVVLGHNADVQKDGGVALGSESVASVDKGQAGYDPETGAASTTTTLGTWKSTNAAVSVGKADGSLTRQITGVAAGTNDTDAVNVAQIKKLASINASNIGANLKKADGTAAAPADVTANKKAWADAIGTGTVTTGDDGSKQLVTGGTVYSEVRPTNDGTYVKTAQTTAQNLSALDTQVKKNADGLSDMNSRSVKYDTKTADGKTVVDNTKITLAGEGGTTVTNVKSALTGATDSKGNAATITTATGAALKNAVNLSDLQAAYNELDTKAQTAHTALKVEGQEAGTGKDEYKGTNLLLHEDTDASTGKVTYDLKLADKISVGSNDDSKIVIDGGDASTIKVGKNISLDGKNGKAYVGGVNIAYLPAGELKYVDENGNAANDTVATGGYVYGLSNTSWNVEKPIYVKGRAATEDQLLVVSEAAKAAKTGLVNKANVAADNIGANLKGSDGTTSASTGEIRTNENNWGKAIGNGVIADPTKTDTNDPEMNGSQQLVTGGTVYKALNGGLTKVVIGTPGKDGKDGEDGKPGTIGLVGPAGTNGKDGAVDITIRNGKDGEVGKDGKDGKDGIKGANGVDGKDGINRIVYEDKNGQHQVATMEDGLKFAGDDAQGTDTSKVIAKKLNNTLNIIGGADSKNLTENNIGVNNADGKLKIQLAKDLTGITSIGNQTTTGEGKDATTTGAKITLNDKDKNISVNGGSIKEVASNLTKDANGKYAVAENSSGNAANMGDVQNLVNQTVADAAYTAGDGIDIKDKTISVKKGDGLKFNDNKELVVNTGDGLEIADGAVKIKTSDSNLTVNSNGIGLSDTVTIGSTDDKKVTIDGTTGEVSGLTNKDWSKDNSSQYEQSGKAATEAQVQKAYNAAVEAAKTDAANNDIHVATGEQAVSNDNTISMKLVDKNGGEHGTIKITDVAKASDLGKISGLNKDLKKADGTAAATVVDAINSVDNKIGDQKYYQDNDGKQHIVSNGSSITAAIGALDTAVQNATTAAGQHSTVSAGSNITVTPDKQSDGHTDYKVALNKDITVDSVTANSVTAKTTTTDTLTVNNNATIGGVTIKDQTISGLKDTDIKEGSSNAVNANTIYKELRPSADGSYIKKDSTTAQNLTNLDTQVKKTSDLINSDGKTIKIGGKDTATKVDVSGKDGQSRVITGVKTDVSDPNSAANVGYVNDMAAASTQQIYQDMNSAYSHVENDISRAAAGSNALAALHPMQEFDPDDKAQYALGYGHYRNSNAGAVGVFYQPDENSLFSIGASFGNGDAGINAGVTVKFGPGGSNHHALTKTQMAKVINEQSQEIDTLKKENADKDKRIDALEQKVNEILAKVEKDKA